MTPAQECYECGTVDPRTSNERNTLYECGEDPGKWQECTNCSEPLCDQCMEDCEHVCQSLKEDW